MNKHVWLLVLVIISVLITSDVYYSNLVKEHDTELSPYTASSIDTFSSTQSWDVQPLALPTGAEPLSSTTINLPPPPTRDSVIERELAYLHTLSTQRSTQTQAMIQAEMNSSTMELGGITLGNLWKHTPHTASLVTYTLAVTEPVILEMKRQFDRVRPSYLDPTLSTAIAVPAHPAYPSGHATQAYLLAQLFSDLNPHDQEAYYRSALRIAHHREIAGLHYPSDSQAGRILAAQLYELLLADEQFLTRYHEARAEW